MPPTLEALLGKLIPPHVGELDPKPTGQKQHPYFGRVPSKMIGMNNPREICAQIRYSR